MQTFRKWMKYWETRKESFPYYNANKIWKKIKKIEKYEVWQQYQKDWLHDDEDTKKLFYSIVNNYRKKRNKTQMP